MDSSELRVANRLAEIERVGDWAEQFGTRHGLPQSVLTDLRISLDEVISNIIAYAYDAAGEREIVVRLHFAAGVLAAEVEDDGLPFDPRDAPPPKHASDIASSPIGGLGIHFLKTLNDEVSYERVGGLNRLGFKKNVA